MWQFRHSDLKEAVGQGFSSAPPPVADVYAELREAMEAQTEKQVQEIAESIRPMVGPGTVVLPLQNGVEAPDQLSAVLGRAPIM